MRVYKTGLGRSERVKESERERGGERERAREEALEETSLVVEYRTFTRTIYIYKHCIRVRRPMVNCPGNCGTLLYISDRQPSPHTISTPIHTGTLHTELTENVRRRRRCRRRRRRIPYTYTI